jgi:hypothetical protein
VLYGLFDFVAQVLHLPRFLNFLRNSESFAITQSVGDQGWLRLPRIMGLAAEPAHTMLPLALAMFVFFRLGGWKRALLLSLSVLFCVATFARSVWIAIAGAALLAFAFRMLEMMCRWRAREVGSGALAAVALVLPLAMFVLPVVLPIAADADLSVLKRMDSSRAGFQLFMDNPVAGVGFEGWVGYPFGFGDDMQATSLIFFVLNGVAIYLAALGVLGLLVVYLPLVLVVTARGLTLAEKGWWTGVVGLSHFGGDYLVFASFWTSIAVVVCWSSRAATGERASASSFRRAPIKPAA